MTEKHEDRAISPARSSDDLFPRIKVTPGSDIRIRLHHQLVRRRRWSKELDRLCGRAA